MLERRFSLKKRSHKRGFRFATLLLVAFFVFVAQVQAAPTTAVLAGGITINEVLADPNGANNFDTDGDGTAETDDEFIEIYNLSGSTVDIGGFELWDEGTDLWFTFPSGTMLGAGNYAVVVGDIADGSLPPVTAGNLAFSSGGASGINNGGDNVILYDPNNDQYVQIVFNGDATDDPTAGTYDGFSATATRVGSVDDFGNDTDGVSLVREPAGDTNVVQHNTISADNASPGAPTNTGGGDTAPSVSSTTPADGATNVAVDANIDITFSEDVTLSAGWFDLTCSDSGTVTATESGSGSMFTLDPDSDFANDESCTLTIFAANVSDVDTDDPPDNMDADFTATFTVESGMTGGTDLVISEIMYNPASDEDNWEWVELYNGGASDIDLSGYVIDDINGVAHGSANIAAGVILAGETAVLYNVDDISATDFEAAWGSGANLVAVTGWGNMALNNGGDTLGLWDSFANYDGDNETHANALISIPYDDASPWPVDDNSASIYLTDLSADATDGSNWALSAVGVDTPTFTGYMSAAAGGNSGSDVGSPVELTVELIISEIMYNPASDEDNWEWVEVFNASTFAVDMSGYVIDDINGTAHGSANIASGTIPAGETAVLYNVDDVTAADFEAAWGTDINLIAVTNWAAMGLNNGGDTVSIWDSFASYDGDHETHANALVTVAFDDSGDWPVDDNAASIYLTDLAADANDGTNWALSMVGESTPAFTGYSSNAAGGNSGNDVGSPGPNAVEEVCGDPFTPIYDIQGSGDASPLDGTVVSTEGIVTATFFGADEIGGFFIQDAAGDGDMMTSDGIYVFTTIFTDPMVGDKVRVTGEVDEFFDLTEITNVDNVIVCGPETPIAATEITLPVAEVGDLEQYEGMLVTFAQELSVTDTFNLHRFGEMVLSANGRQINQTNANPPGPIGADDNDNNVQDVNEPGRILLDDGSSAEFPAIIPYLGADETRRLGDTTDNLTGVLSYGFGSYRVQPTEDVTFERDNPREASPDSVAADLTVASFNVLNYFTTIDDGSNNARGADSVAEFERQEDKLVTAILGLGADIVGLQEIENNGDVAISALVDALNAEAGAGTWDYIDDPVYNGDPDGLQDTNAIKVAIIYQPAIVTPVGDSVADEDAIFAEDRPPVAQTFAHNATGEVVTVIVNHFKSKGCSGATGLDEDQNDGQGCYNERRTEQAQALLDFTAEMQTISGDDDVIVLGDLNSYSEEDPITTLESGLVNQVDAFVALDDKYSFTFFGQSGLLDYVFTTSSLDSAVASVDVWHINTDEPRVLSYNDDIIDSGESNSAFEQDYVYDPDQYRSSDHDPVIIWINFADPAPMADVSVSKVDATDPVMVGDDIEYTVTVSNSGPDTAVNVTLVDTLDSDTSYVSATPDVGSCSESGGTITCSLGDLSSGASVDIVIVATADAEGTVTNTATVNADTDDPDSSNNSASEDTAVEEDDGGFPTNDDGCYVLALYGSPFTGEATTVYYHFGNYFFAQRWANDNGIPAGSCYEIHGTNYDDRLYGGFGDDVFFGYAGNDSLVGRGGDDTFTTGTGWDRVFGGNGYDVVTDYQPGFDRCRSVEDGC